MGKSHALEKFPMLRKESLVGGIVYYDGKKFQNFDQFHECRDRSYL